MEIVFCRDVMDSTESSTTFVDVDEHYLSSINWLLKRETQNANEEKKKLVSVKVIVY